MPLTDKQCKNFKPDAKTKKHFDGHGLFLEISPKGNKSWKYKYNFLDKEKKLTIGKYPTISLSAARDLRREAEALLIKDIDPSASKKAKKRELQVKHNNNFKAIAEEWHELQKEKWTEKHAKTMMFRMERNLFAELGDIPIADLKSQNLLACLKKMEKRDAIDLMHRMQQTVGQIMRYAISTGRAEYDISVPIRGALKTRKKISHAYLKADELREFFEKLEKHNCEGQTRRAIKLTMLTMVRTTELRKAKWEEINFEKAEWRIPAERMKMRELHIVPLSKQTLQLFTEQRQSHNHEYVFPQMNNHRKCMSENAMLYAVYEMGFKGRTTIHGFRGTASTILNEHGFNKDHVETQLSHGERNQVRASYNHAKYLEARKEMMQWWADYLDEVKK